MHGRDVLENSFICHISVASFSKFFPSKDFTFFFILRFLLIYIYIYICIYIYPLSTLFSFLPIQVGFCIEYSDSFISRRFFHFLFFF